MTTISSAASPIRPQPPTAASMARGVNGNNLEAVSMNLAQDSATVMQVMDTSDRKTLAADVQALKTQLWARLSERQMDTALMTAGALLSGPHGVTLHELAGALHGVLASRPQLEALAEKMKHFEDPAPTAAYPRPEDVYHSINTHVTHDLAQSNLGGQNVPTALFISGALASSYQTQGGLPSGTG